jgi:hypothetical protein
LGFDPELPAMPFDDFFAHGQADPIACVFGPRMQSAKDDKDVLPALGRDADTVI